MTMEKIVFAIIIIIVLALQYFISSYKGGFWKYIIPIIFILTLLILLLCKIITLGSFILYFIIGLLVLLAQSFMAEEKSNK